MRQNEANTLGDDYADLPEPLRPLAVTVDRIIQDDHVFNLHLIELVYFGLKPSDALWLYCRRHRMDKFVIGDLLLDDHPMVNVLEWICLHFLQDGHKCNEHLIALVNSGGIRASQAVYLYCRHHGTTNFTLVNRKRPHARRSKVVDFFDSVVPCEFAGFLNVVDKERIAGTL